MKSRRNVIVIGALVLLLGGCATVGPDYVRPKAQEPAAWVEKDPRITQEPADLSAWWKVFNDPVLDGLIETAYQQNLSLQIAGIRILEARVQLGIAKGNLYPQVQTLSGSLTHANLSQNSANALSVLDFGYNDLVADFGAAWEIDLWGKFRRGIEASNAALEGNIATYDDVLVSLTANVAGSYVMIRTFEARLDVARTNVNLQEQTLRIAEAQFEGGLVTELDVLQARNLLYATKASIPPLEAGRRQSQNSLATLLGVLPENVQELLGGPKPIPLAPVEVAVGVPAELLRRRPDIRLAERQVAAQCALIGVAKADLYPHFSLFGSIGLRTSDTESLLPGGPGGIDLGDLLSSNSLQWFVGPSFTWDVLNYGRIKNKVRVEDARFQQLGINYQNTVLRAVQEVEDGLAGFIQASDASGFYRESVTAAERSVRISLVQYREGLVDYQRVLDAQRALASSQDALVSTSGSVATNLIAAYRALGGGWENRLGKDFIPAAIKEEMVERTDWGNLLESEPLEPESKTSDVGLESSTNGKR